MRKRTYDWIRYNGVFIKVRQLPEGGHHAIVTEVMPDYPVRDMLVAATFEGTYIEQAPAVIDKPKEEDMSIFKPTPAEQAQRAKAAANYPWPVKIVLGLIEFALYILLGSLALAIIAAPIVGIVWLAGKLFGAW